MPLLACRYLPLGVNGLLYSACVFGIMLYESEIESANQRERGVTRLERNDARMDALSLRIGFLQRNYDYTKIEEYKGVFTG